MFRSKLLRADFLTYLHTWRGYLSNEFKNVAKEGYHSAFVSKIAQPTEDGKPVKNINVAEQFSLLRSKKLATASLDSAGYSIIDYFLKTNNMKDLVSVIANRLEYGVFLTPFNACYLLDYYLDTQDFASAAQVAIEASLQELLDNPLVAALAVKAIFAHINEMPEVEPAPPKVEGKITEQKVRVKFLRNPPDLEMGSSKLNKKHISLALSHLCTKFEDPMLKTNCELLALMYGNQNDKFVEFVKSNSAQIHKDVLAVCQNFYKNEEAMLQILAELKVSESNLHDFLDKLIKECAEKEETQLVEAQQQEYVNWLKQHKIDMNTEEAVQNRMERVKNIETILADIKAQRQKLWFFEDEEKIDLQIYNKRPKYQKRWFGKKKKPKVIDENYIPPTVR